MDFIDRWLGLTPDGAGRVVELLILIVLTSVIIGFILYFFRDHDVSEPAVAISVFLGGSPMELERPALPSRKRDAFDTAANSIWFPCIADPFKQPRRQRISHSDIERSATQP